MGGPSRERRAARRDGKPRSATAEGPATDRGYVKRGGSGAEARPDLAGADHGEAEAQEGQVGRRTLNVARWRGPILVWTKAL